MSAVDLFADFAINPETEKDGVWVPYRDDVAFLIARSGNANYRKKIAFLVKKNQRVIDQGGDVGEAKSEEIFVDVLASTVLLGWKGKLVFQGEDLSEYSVASAKKLLALKLFREWVTKQAEDEKAYKAVQEEADEKN